MIEKVQLRDIGKFQRTHALKGELNVQLDIDYDYFVEHPWVIVDMEGIPTPFKVEGIRPKGATTSLVKLKGIDSEEDARIFVNKPVSVPDAELKEYLGDGDGDEMYAADFIGFSLIDQNGKYLGVIEDLDLTSEENPLFEVKKPEGGTFLVPVADDLIMVYDPEEKTVTMNIPEGLLDIQ